MERDRPHRLRVLRRSTSLRSIRRGELEAGREEFPPEINAADPRPSTWGECQERGLGSEHPCPYVSCAHHLLFEVSPRGSIRWNRAEREPDALPQTCALAVAEEGPHTLEAIGELLGLSRERVRQLELHIFRKIADEPALVAALGQVGNAVAIAGEESS